MPFRLVSLIHLLLLGHSHEPKPGRGKGAFLPLCPLGCPGSLHQGLVPEPGLWMTWGTGQDWDSTAPSLHCLVAFPTTRPLLFQKMGNKCGEFFSLTSLWGQRHHMHTSHRAACRTGLRDLRLGVAPRGPGSSCRTAGRKLQLCTAKDVQISSVQPPQPLWMQSPLSSHTVLPLHHHPASLV